MNAFFTLAAVSPTRQNSLRTLAVAHVLGIAALVASAHFTRTLRSPLALGNLLLIAGVIEGALLVGWRLAQLPKSQALEFLLVSPLHPSRVFLGEAAVGLARLALVTLAGLPLLCYLIGVGMLVPEDLLTLVALPLVWGAFTGLGLTAWAYESVEFRRWGERIVIAGILFYLLVGVLAAEHLPLWLGVFPRPIAIAFYSAFFGFHEYNPFGIVRHMLESAPGQADARVVWGILMGLVLAGLCLARATWRMLDHFRDTHYRPLRLEEDVGRAAVGDWPLTWWAVKRVSKYSGRINLWLAGGFALLFAAYTLAGDRWPAWLGSSVFQIFERLGGIPMLTTALVLLAAVPAAFQYGLWDHSDADRVRRLELLLLTGLGASSYWDAAFQAAWKRGRGYFAIALVLWASAYFAGQMTEIEVVAALSAGVILWGLYFALGFQAFSRGKQANLLGLTLTLVLPAATAIAARQGFADLAVFLPPGGLFFKPDSPAWVTGVIVAGGVTMFLIHHGLTHCDHQLRRWYDLNHGARAT